MAYILMINQSTIAGTEALFADLAHFPVSAIQLAFTVVVFPCLLLAYSGQAAYLMKNKEHVIDAFYRSIPGLYDIVIFCCVFFVPFCIFLAAVLTKTTIRKGELFEKWKYGTLLMYDGVWDVPQEKGRKLLEFKWICAVSNVNHSERTWKVQHPDGLKTYLGTYVVSKQIYKL